MEGDEKNIMDVYTFRDMQRKLRKNGYELDHIKGSHYVYKNCKGNVVTINLRLNPMVAKRLVRENRLR